MTIPTDQEFIDTYPFGSVLRPVEGGGIPLTQDEYDEWLSAQLVELANERQKETNINDELRRLAYQKESDPIFFKWQRGESTKEEWLNKVEQIKEQFSLPIRTVE